MRAWAALVVTLAIAGCGDPLADACGGARPELASCPRGLYFAECGGEATPTLACDGRGCLWFAGSCVASGFRPTQCPVGDACCRSSAAGPWPYADGWGGSYQLRQDLAVIGDRPVARDDAAISVVIDAAITDPGAIAVACEGELDLAICAGGVTYRPTREVGGSWVMELAASYPYGELTQLEVRPRSDGTLGARVYVSAYTDVSDAVATCEGSSTSRTPEPQSGTLALAPTDFRDPLAVHGEAAIALETGTLRLRF